jgi:integrase
MERRNALEQARKVKQRCGMIFRYAVAIGRAERDPSQDLRGALKTRKVRHYPSIPFSELPALLDAIDQSGAALQTRLAIDGLLHCFVRTNELRGARWDAFDLDTATWRIPSERIMCDPNCGVRGGPPGSSLGYLRPHRTGSLPAMLVVTTIGLSRPEGRSEEFDFGGGNL